MKKIIFSAVTVLFLTAGVSPVRADMNELRAVKWLQRESNSVSGELVNAWLKGEDKEVVENLLGTWLRLQIELANRDKYGKADNYFQKIEKILPPQGSVPAKILAYELEKYEIKTDLRSILEPVTKKWRQAQ